MIRVENNIVVTFEDGTTISMTKTEAEKLYSALAAALNKVYQQQNPNSIWYTVPRDLNTVTCGDSTMKGYQ